MAGTKNTKDAGRAETFWEEPGPAGLNHLLVIAIDAYAHCPQLNNCVKDAREFIKVLTHRYQFQEENIITLFNEDATRPNIHARLKELKKKVKPEDNLTIYFSGHGETEDNVGYWVPVEAHPGREWEYFSTDEIKRRLDAINSFHTFVLVDACFSGALFATFKSVRPGYETKRSRWGLAASHSRERALDGTAGENSPFAATVLRQLRNSEQNLTIQELATEVINRVEQATEGRQTPVFKPLNVKGDDSGQYVFHLKANEAADWLTAQKAGTLAAYQAFLAKYPESNHSAEARREGEIERAWKEVKDSGSAAALEEFREKYPEHRYAGAAERVIRDLRKTEEPKTPSEPVGTASEPSFPIDKYFPWAAGLLVVIILIIGFSGGWFTGEGTPDESSGQDTTTQQTARPQVDPVEDKKPEEAPYQPPQIERSFRGDILTVTIQQGKGPYDLRLVRKGATVYQQKLDGPGAHRITLTDYREDPGTYTIQVEDAAGEKADRNIRIDAPKVVPPPPPAKTRTVTLGGQTYRTVRLNGLTWMAENLNYNLGEGSWCYDNDPANCGKTGRLYTWEAAKKACRAVGWRLPTDTEWREMAKQFGGADDDASDGGKAAYQALIEGGPSGFAAQRGGIRNSLGDFINLGVLGLYWSASERGADLAWRYYFSRNYGKLYRFYFGNKSVGLSCRCVQD